MDEQEGALEIEYMTNNLTTHEKLSIVINGEVRCKGFNSHIDNIDFIREDTVGEQASLIKFYLEPKMHKVEIIFESNGG
jgi:hypothetical protein